MSRQFSIPDSLVRTRTELHGSAGADWARQLPALLADCERKWSLKIGSPFLRLSYNYAAPALRADGVDVVVKVCFPDREFRTEVEALRLYAGRGAVELLDVDLERGVMLLERLKPGTMLLSVEDDEAATSIAAAVMRQLWRPVPEEHTFPSIADWGKGFERMRAYFGGTTGPFPQKLTDDAEQLFADMLNSMEEPVVLHGDLHHFNILAAERQPWLAIDPKGVVGEPAYETGALLRNPWPELRSRPDPKRTLARRVDQLADELGLDRRRILAWGLGQAVLSAWWLVEDHGDDSWKTAIEFAEMLASIKV